MEPRARDTRLASPAPLKKRRVSIEATNPEVKLPAGYGGEGWVAVLGKRLTATSRCVNPLHVSRHIRAPGSRRYIFSIMQTASPSTMIRFENYSVSLDSVDGAKELCG